MIPAIGFAVHGWNRRMLDTASIDDPAINAVELDMAGSPGPPAIDGAALRPSDFDLVSVRALTLSVGGPEAPCLCYLNALKALALENGAASISDCLGSAPGAPQTTEIARYASPYARAALASTCRNVSLVQKHFGSVRFYLENTVVGFRADGGMTEARFLASVLRKSGCGWLLDVTRTYAAAAQAGDDPTDVLHRACEFVEEVLPSAPRIQMRVTGLADDRSADGSAEPRPIPEPILDLYQFVLESAFRKVDAIFVDWEPSAGDDAHWRAQTHTVRRIAESVRAIV